MRSFPVAFAALIGVFLALFLVGCDNPFAGSSPTEPTNIFLAGTCRATSEVGQIVCEDRSETEPAGRLDSVTFLVLDDRGLTVETRQAPAGQDPPRVVTFSGLRRGTYTVEHTVRADGKVAQAFYRSLTLD